MCLDELLSHAASHPLPSSNRRGQSPPMLDAQRTRRHPKRATSAFAA
jgi:hypothetical protein